MNYQKLREQYPAVITMDQFYRICHISKRKARWLLEHGVVPCRDSGKKTRRFKIRLADVIAFLERRDAGDPAVAAPKGAFSSGAHVRKPGRVPLTASEREKLRASLLAAWESWPDALTVRQAAELCGCSENTMHRWARKGAVTSVAYRGAYLVSKEGLAGWMAIRRGGALRQEPWEPRQIDDPIRFV